MVNNQVIRDIFKRRVYLGMPWNVKRSFPNHREKISFIAKFGILLTFIGMDINILSTYTENFCPNFFLGKKYGSKMPYIPTIRTNGYISAKKMRYRYWPPKSSFKSFPLDFNSTLVIVQLGHPQQNVLRVLGLVLG